jgi:RimJ/RimL family protein N-acetyltransferase
MTAAQPPERVDLEDIILRRFRTGDAEAVARAVEQSFDHLQPWMPWANAEAIDPNFQRQRIAKLPDLARRGEEWQFGLFAADESQLLGSFGLMTRRGPHTIEIGYWLHVDAGGRGYATRAAGALTDVGLALPDVDRSYICCDEANVRSAAIPRRLGYRLSTVEHRAPEAPGESGRLQQWVCESA